MGTCDALNNREGQRAYILITHAEPVKGLYVLDLRY